MPELLKKKLEAKPSIRNAYAVMNSMGAMRGSKTTAKGRRIERKLRRRHRATMKDAGDALAAEDPILDR
jgi:hypothetical protein